MAIDFGQAGYYQLPREFVARYRDVEPEWKFGALGHLTFYRTYSRIKDNGEKEKWWETVRRVVEGIYTIQRQHIEHNNLYWDSDKADRSACEMYERIFDFRFLPPGRLLSNMGTEIVHEKGLNAVLMNCSFTSTAFIDKELSKPFQMIMDYSMLGVGCGADLRGAGKISIHKPNKQEYTFEIPDTREGWVASLQRLLSSYFMSNKDTVRFDYSRIRPAGAPIKGMGGTSSGPGPLKEMLELIRERLDANVGKLISESLIADIINLIGRCVVSGNVRRTALLLLSETNSDEFLDLKDYNKNQYRSRWAYTSNNSVIVNENTDYEAIAKRIVNNGEPGLFWIDNARNYGRMREDERIAEPDVMGANPCVEQSLEHAEFCCLVETFPNHHETKEDFFRTLKFAYLVGKTVTLTTSHWQVSNAVQLRNRRIGLSLSGVTSFIQDKGYSEAVSWLREGYREVRRRDVQYSNWLAVPKSVKVTTIKPSGTVSLLAGATPGAHYGEGEYYIRRMRYGKHGNGAILQLLRDAGYIVEDDVMDKDNTAVVEFPIASRLKKTTHNTSIWEKYSVACLLQRFWSDNMVSFTCTFNPQTEASQIAPLLQDAETRLKSISMLPMVAAGAYPQMPYEAISEERYNEIVSKIKPLDFAKINVSKDIGDEKEYCDSDKCEWTPPEPSVEGA